VLAGRVLLAEETLASPPLLVNAVSTILTA